METRDRAAAETPETFHWPVPPVRIKGGPLAAGIATLAIVGLTAVPDVGTATPAPDLLPAARAERVRGAIASDVHPVHLNGAHVAAVTVGDRRFDLEPGARLVELPDGSAVMEGHLVPPGLAPRDSGFLLELEFKAHGDSGLGDQVPAPPRLATSPLDGSVVVTRAFGEGENPVPRFGGMSGRLEGTGAAKGLTLDIRPLADTPVGATPMELGEGDGPAMVLVGRFTWMTGEGASAGDFALPDDGFGSLAIAVQRGATIDRE